MTKHLKNISNEDGYTFIEIFVAVIIIGIISTIVIINSSQITDSITQGKQSLSKKMNLITLKLVLKEEAQKINTTWFLKEHVYESNENKLIVYYYNGSKEDFLTLESTDYGIKISNSDGVIYSSNKLNGTFSIDGSFIMYKDDERTLSFPLGVFLA